MERKRIILKAPNNLDIIVTLWDEGVIVDVFDDNDYTDDSLVATTWELYTDIGISVIDIE